MKRILAVAVLMLGSGLLAADGGQPADAAAAVGEQEPCLYTGDRSRLAEADAVVELEVVGSRTPPSDPRTVLFPEVEVLQVLRGRAPDERFVLRVAVEPFPGECEFALDTPRYWVVGIERATPGADWAFETSTQLVIWAGPERSGPEYQQALAVIKDANPAAPGAGTGTVVLTEAENDIPWGAVAMVAILLMSFGGCTVAIVRSARRRR